MRCSLNNLQSILTTSVDDMLIASTMEEESDAVVNDIQQHFKLTDNSDVNFHLGCTIIQWRSRRTLKLHQQAYTESILRDVHMEGCNPVSTPMHPNTRLSTDDFPLTRRRKSSHPINIPILPHCRKMHVLVDMYMTRHHIHCSRTCSFHVQLWRCSHPSR